METRLCTNCFAAPARRGRGRPARCAAGTTAGPRSPRGCPAIRCWPDGTRSAGPRRETARASPTRPWTLPPKRRWRSGSFSPCLWPSGTRTAWLSWPRRGRTPPLSRYLDDFVELSKGISRLREISVVQTVQDIFEENYTRLHRVRGRAPPCPCGALLRTPGASSPGTRPTSCSSRCSPPWGLMNSLNLPHLGVSPETLRVTRGGPPAPHRVLHPGGPAGGHPPAGGAVPRLRGHRAVRPQGRLRGGQRRVRLYRHPALRPSPASCPGRPPSA